MDESDARRLVFISHSGVDTWVAKQIAREIERCGAQPFLDEADIHAGADFEGEILSFLQRTHEFVVLLTPWALDRPYVWAETGVAWGRRIPIVGLLHGMSAGDLLSRSGVPIFLKARDLLELDQIDTYFGQLQSRVEAHHAERSG